jgi:5-enolpyruvylshikimate-3-phosphate synthase
MLQRLYSQKTKIETTAGNVMTKMTKKDYIDYTLNVLVSFGVAVDSAIGFLNRL